MPHAEGARGSINLVTARLPLNLKTITFPVFGSLPLGLVVKVVWTTLIKWEYTEIL